MPSERQMCLVASMPAAVLIILSESTFGSAMPFVQDARDLEPALEQLGEEFFTGDRIVTHVVVRLVVAAKWNRILDFVFCHHGRVRLSLEMGRSLIRVG
jgi:hypothetical protein